MIDISRRITQEEFDKLERSDRNYIYCPVGDYSEIKKFPDKCIFPDYCKFSDNTSFGEFCHFGFNCFFDKLCVFNYCCSFGHHCYFLSDCIFGYNCNFGTRCSYGDRCVFVGECVIGAFSIFGSSCRFGFDCSFGERCAFGNHTYYGCEKNIRYFACERMGSTRDKIYFFRSDNGYFVGGGFVGTLDEFVDFVHSEYGGTKYERQYLAAVELAKSVLEGESE